MANNPNVNKVVLGSETLLDLSDDTATAEDVVSGKTFHLKSGAKATGTASYAGSPVAGGNADISNGILYGTVDSTSTATVFTATVDGLTSLYDGVTVVLHNGVVTSASGFTINVNGLGAKKCYNNLTNATQDTTIFNIAYTMMFIYSEALDNGNGGWWCYRGYDGNTNTIGYQVRTNSGNLVAADTGYRYRLWLTSADGSKWVPINTSTSTNSTTARTLNTRPIDPFGPIVYRSTNGTCSAGTGIGATGIWQQYTLTIGYSYMASRFALTFPDSVFLRCTPQSDGSAVMNDIVQALPSTKDGKIYIHLGTAYSATNMELQIEHPVYWHDGTGIRLWTGAEPVGGDVSMTEEEVDAAVEEAFSSMHIITYSLSNLSTDKRVAVEGETVTVTITSMSGYSHINALYDPGTGLTNLGSWTSVGTYTFTMPAYDVRIDGIASGGSND